MTCNMNCASAFVATVRRGMLAVGAVLFLLPVDLPASAQEGHFVTFEAPGAGTSGGQGTAAQGINLQGEIAGYYVDSNYVYHGFVRTGRGDITIFDAPGADTFPYGDNPEGAVAGFYFDSNGVYHGFLRSGRGNITPFDAPGAVDTFAAQINPAGVIAGDYLDAGFVSHAYLRTTDGKITPFDAPGAGTGAYQGTMTGFIDCINPAGAMTGYVIDAGSVYHGYLRAPGGKVTTFDAPGAGTGAGQGTFPAGINSFGAIEGNYVDAGNVTHGFVRAPFGTIYTFDAPGADTTPGNNGGTYPQSINALGAISGYYRDANNVNHGFVRDARGRFRNFQAPGADTTPGSNNGTFPYGMNDAGAITGYYQDAQGVAHGFVLVPDE